MTHLPTPKARFLIALKESIESDAFVRLTLGHPSDSANPLRKLLLRPVLIRGEKRCSVVSRFTTRDETKNLPFPETLALVEARLGSAFLSAALFTESEELHLELDKKARLRTVRVEHRPATLGHDRLKTRKTDARASYLRSLSVTDSHGKVRERMGDKFRQIERFVDLLDSAFRESELAKGRRTGALDTPITLCDMGAGKGYLTFAACDYLQRVAKVPASVTGVELRDDLVALCNQAAEDCGFQDLLRFVKSDIGGFTLPSVDILVALHACNTATDDALAAGIRAGAEIILAAPCCHKEARPQVDAAASAACNTAPKSPLSDVLRHGIFAERHAEMATDGLRALLLERAGYRVRVSEFVAAEHTAKNVMLIATRKASPISQQTADTLSERIAALKTFYGILHHRLEELLVG